MRGTRAKKRGRPPKASNNDSRYIYSTKLNRVEEEEEEDSNHSSSTTNTSASKYQTRASRKPSYRIGITIERKKTRKRKKGEESEEEDYYVDDEYEEEQAIQSDEDHNSDDDEASAEDEIDEEEEVEEEESEEDESIKKRLRPAREAAPLFLDDTEIPELNLPPSSEDLLISGKELMRALSVYEILRHFQNTLRLTPFRFEDFCVALLIDEQTYLLSEIHIQLLKALIREDDLVGTQHGPQDVRDSINAYLFLCDHLTWPEVLRIYLSSDLKKNSHIIQNCLDSNYPFSSIQNKLSLLEHLCDEFLNTQSSREFLNNEGVIKHEDNCRVCHKPGDLLCCETCPAVFHLTCLDPPLKQVPTEEWICPICKLNSVNGITDCMSDFEKHGFLSRQEPIGWDRNGRKYWLLSRRLIVEDHKSDENIFYYSSRLQFDELMESLDEENYEKDLCKVLFEMKDDIYRQMAITEKLTKTAKGSGPRRSYLEVVNEELFIKRSAKLENHKDGSTVHNTINDEKYAELESKLAVDDDDTRGGVLTRLKTGSLQPKSISSEPLKNRVNVYNSLNFSFREEDSVITFQENSTTLTRTLRKLLPHNFNQTNLFKLGLEGNYRQYQNIYSLNQYALNKFQHADDRDKKRHLSHKFSLTQASDLKWTSYTNINTALMTTTLHGTKSMLINILRQALLYLETQFTQTFMHPNWQVHRTNWIKAVSMCSEPKEFSLALYILESSMKPVLFNSAWHDTLGFTVLQRSTQLERDELKKKDKKDRRDLNEPVTLDSEGPNTSRYYGAGVGVKLVFGKLKHQIWKQKGEEYRLSGIGGWNWLSSTRIKYPACEKSTVEKELCPDFDSPCTLIDISKALQQRELPLRKHYPKVYKASKLDSLLKARLDMFNTEKKRLPANKKEQKDSFSGFRCYSCCCDPILPNRCYSPLCVFDSQKTNFSDTDDFGDTSEHVELIQVTLVDGVEQFAKKTIPFNSKGQLPPSSRFFNGVYRSILILPAHEMRKLGRNGGLREVTGFSYNCKINNTVWPYGLTPRPYFRTMWLLRTHYFNNLHAAALQLRVFWASIRWDDLATKPPLSGTNTITTENEVQTIEILKRRDLPPFGLRSEYLIRKIIVPIDLPVRQREVSTPNRSGLRERRRPESPQVKGPRMTELWINEEEIELWEIRQFGDKAEKQLLMAKQRANQEEKQRQLEMLRKKNEEQRKLNFDSNKMINGSININPAKSITSRLTSIFQNRGSNKIQISSPITLTSTSQINTTSANPTVTYATIRTASGTFKIPVQQSNNRSTTQQLIIRPGTQIIAGNPNQQTIINSLTNAANRPTTATYIVRSPNIASNRPIIISNSLNGPIVRPINNIQTNIKQSIPLISTSTPQKISTMTTVNAILTSTPAKTIVSLPQSVATSSTTNAVISSVNIASSSTLNQTKNIQCVQVKLNDGRTHLLPITSLTGNNQTLQIAVNPNSSNQPYRILTKPSDNTTAKDGQNKPILLTGNSILTPNTFILSNVNNSKVIVQPTISTVQVNTTPTVVSTSTQNTNKIELSKANPTITKTISVNQKEPILQTKVEDSTQSSSNVLPTPKANNAEEKEFVLTAEITQEIIRKALMEPSLQPEMSQKLMAYQRHHQEQFDSNPTQKSPLKVFAPPNLSSRVSSRSSRYSRGKYDSDDYIIDFPKNERTYHSEEDEVTRVCRSIVKTLLDKLEKEEKRIKNKEINEERKQKRAAILKNKYRQNHIELLRRSIIRRKAKFNRSIKIRVEEEILSKLSQVKRVSPKVNICSTSDNIPVVVPSLTKRKLEEEFVQQSLKISEIKTEPSDSLNHSIEESKPKRARMSVTVSPSVSHTSAKKTSNVSKTSPKGRNKELYCICKRPYDNSLMIACDSCSNWYHPMCVGVAPHMVKEIGDYTCPSCRGRQSTQPLSVNNDSLTLEKRSSLAPNRNNSRRPRNSNSRSRKSKPNRSAVENISSSSHQSDEREMEQDDSLYCVCRKVYDPSQFYICCDRCQDWFHGRCVGVTSAEADSIEDYVCPQCEGDTSINFLNIKDLSELDYSNLLKLHKTVQSHRNAWPFLKPVDKKQVPDYYTIIKEPMDLKKIEGRLNGRAYKKLAEFIYDMNKMFDNCRLYNARTSQYYQCAEILEGFFLSKIRAFRDVGK